ncbi:MAG: hypothetical protein DRJ66_01525 [Thermoprotei archaeon]|nr:MAG: hypothetical protein DRJ66_01525 [Thermoprotei archaeon]RLF20614.1 MAG: hypothetical protein DRZ82_01730 [Thermoprotei archaeon]
MDEDSRRRLKLLFIANVGIAICINMIMSLQSLYLADLGASVSDIGYVFSLTSAISTAFMFIFGLISDLIDPGTVISMCFFLLVISGIFLGYVRTWREAIPFLVLSSSAFAIFIPIRMLMIANMSKERKMGITYGVMNLSWPIGGLIGPILGGILAERWGWKALYSSEAITALFFMVPSLMLRKGENMRRKIRSFSLKMFRVTRDVIIFLLAYGILSTSRGMLDPILPIYLDEEFSLTKSQIGFFSSIGLGLATMITQVPSGMLGDRIGYKKAMVLFTLPIPLILFIWPHVDNVALLGILYMTLIGTWSATWPSSISYIVRISSKDIRSVVITLRQTSIRVGFIIGPSLAGILWSHYDASLVFYGMAVISLIALLFMLILGDERRR